MRMMRQGFTDLHPKMSLFPMHFCINIDEPRFSLVFFVGIKITTWVLYIIQCRISRATKWHSRNLKKCDSEFEQLMMDEGPPPQK